MTNKKSKEVELVYGAHIAVRVDRHAAHHRVFNPGGGERAEE